MDTLDLLRRAVLDHPDEDVPRLMLADELERRGSARDRARAEFVRVQCEHHRIREACDGEGYVGALLVREEVLLRKWGTGWLPRCGRPRNPDFVTVRGDTLTIDTFTPNAFTFGRGFVSAARLVLWPMLPEPPGFSVEGFAATARQILSAHPCERITLAVEGHEPEVVLRVGRGDGNDLWAAALHPPGDGRGEWCRFSPYYPARRDLLRGLPDWLAECLPRVTFTPREIEIPF